MCAPEQCVVVSVPQLAPIRHILTNQALLYGFCNVYSMSRHSSCLGGHPARKTYLAEVVGDVFAPLICQMAATAMGESMTGIGCAQC
jgi:hypothetical protein